MSDMFEYLEAQAREENLPFKNAAAVAIDRSERRFGSFISGAQGAGEFNSRLALVESEVRKIADAVCEEYGYGDPEHIAKLALGQLQLFAADAETGDNYQQDRQDLKTQSPEGYYTEPSPKLNPGKAGDENSNALSPIDVGSVRNQLDNQTATEFNYPWNGDIGDPSPVRDRVDADTPMQPEFNVGDKTMTFPNKGQADPVTSKTAAEPNWNNSNFDESAAWDDSDDALEQRRDEWEYAEDSYENPWVDDQDFMNWAKPSRGAGPDNYRTQDVLGPEDFDNPKDYWESLRSEYDQEKNVIVDDPHISKAAAERMDFNSLKETMTPSEAIDHLKEAGMEEHEAKDRVDWYVNHVDPGWAHKAWTSSEQKESVWDQSDPTLIEMSSDIGDVDVDQIRALYEQYANSDSFETAQDAINAIFAMYAENASPNQINQIAESVGQATGRMPSNVEEVIQHITRFAKTKTADHVGVYRDILNMINERIDRGDLSEAQIKSLEETRHEVEQQYEMALADRGMEAGISHEELSWEEPRVPMDETEVKMMDQAQGIDGGAPVGIDPETGGPSIQMKPTEFGGQTPPGEKNRRKPLIGDRAFNNVANAFLKKMAEDIQKGK